MLGLIHLYELSILIRTKPVEIAKAFLIFLNSVLAYESKSKKNY